jgi:serine/threonine protein kinase/Tol biopolymer transport system component
MTLSAGARLGPYEILSPLGVGGMGEVYRARDTRLERTVAIKVLPEHLSSSAEVRQRFEREAKTISQLSHPHICALYDVGNQDGVEYLVMEYLEGETLAERLVKGPLPLEQTLRCGVEIADALDKAHRQGIVHRDLKPGNVMLTKSGVKLLDFGLAKAIAPSAPAGSLTALPTQANLTQEGTILGTFQYMAPEQLEGKEADARTDIFALGAVLYEMATGRKAFEGKSQASLIAAILDRDPDPVSAIQPMTPPSFDRVVKTCLAKDPEERWQSAHDLGSELRWILEIRSGGRTAEPLTGRPSRRRERFAWGAAILFLFTTVGLTVAYFNRATPSRRRPVRLQVVSPPDAVLGWFAAVSPDGNWLAFTAAPANGTVSLWLRSLGSLGARSLPGTEGAGHPFWSPDSHALGFFAGGKLKTIDLSGGTPQTVCEASNDARGGTWGADGTIVFAPFFQGGLFRVPATGGEVSPTTVLDPVRKEQTHRWPSFLPDGRHFLYYASRGSGEEPGEILVGSLDRGPPKRLLQSSSLALFAAPGYLLYSRGGTLLAQPFDSKDLRLTGKPVPIAERLWSVGAMSGLRIVSVSSTGVLVYQTGSGNATQLVWLDRSGRELGTLGPPADYYAPRLSPDGTRLAEGRSDPESTTSDIWLTDLTRNVSSRFTFDPADDVDPVWSPDGKRLFFASSRDGVQNLYQAASDRPGSEELLLRSGAWKVADDVSPDGRFLIYETSTPTRIDLWILPLSGDRTPRPYVATPFGEFSAQFSPDGRWVAYVSNESGRAEVYVQPFPGPGGKWQVSTAGGSMPGWRRDGKELFYFGADGRLMATEVALGLSFESRTPTALFKVSLPSPDRQYDVTSDGSRILVNRISGEVEGAPITVVLDWAAGLEPK